jgi:general secretion pathway protein G
MDTSTHRRSGLTLIEVLIVVMVIAILAAIVLPRIWPTRREAAEGQLKGNLHELRTSIALFQAHCGDWPGQLSDLVATTGTGLVGGNGVSIPEDCYKGPYFTASPDGHLPLDPMTGVRDWTYEPTTGAVHSSSDGVATDGSHYSAW